jgi:DNA helicase HerA-like ATPase
LSEVGIVIGEARPERVEFTSKIPVRVGDYVTVDTDDGQILYMTEYFKNISELLSGPNDYQTADEARRASLKNPRDRVRIGVARALGLVDELLKGRRIYPTLPPEPGASVKHADDNLLKKIYGVGGNAWVEIGHLLRRPSVTVAINLDAVASRHLAILAATGKGKSNLLALLAKKFSEKNATMVIFDYHGEYQGLRIRGIKNTSPKINPKHLDSEELAEMLGVWRNAVRQRAILGKVYTKDVVNAVDYWKTLKKKLKDIAEDEESGSQDKLTAQRLLEIIERALAVWGRVFDPKARSPLDTIVNNRVNVFDISDLTETQAQIVVNTYLNNILQDRKTAVRGGEGKFRSPVVVAIEEAHVFMPAGGSTECSETIARIAREGRKFGVSLIVVSQRPSRLNSDITSQMGNFAISGITHPNDQSFINKVTDEVSTELGASLPSLNPGEMILAGHFIKVPALIKTQLVEEKLVGRDLEAVKLWEAETSRTYVATEELMRP